MQLRAEDLNVNRGGRPILQGLSFSLHAGEALLLTGPNGAGKTTLIRTIAGFLRPASGKLAFSSGPVPLEISEQCHYVGHQNAVKASLTVAENLAFWARFISPPPADHAWAGPAPSGQTDASAAAVVDPAGAAGPAQSVAQALQRFNLAGLSHIPAGYLSAGQKRRLGLARLLVVPRPLWLLDEPTVSLDKASQQILAEAVNEHVSAGGMAVAATHLPLGLAAPLELRLGGGNHAVVIAAPALAPVPPASEAQSK